MTPGDITYPEHLSIGLGKYLQSAMNRQPDFGGINQMFSNLGNQGGAMVRGNQFYDPSQAQQYATPAYLAGRGDIAQANIGNMFSLADLALQTGTTRGNLAAMIPELQAQKIRASLPGSTAGLFGMFG